MFVARKASADALFERLGRPDLADEGLLRGAPGAADPIQSGGYAAWKTANGIVDDGQDDDNDNIPAIIEFALGTSTTASSSHALPIPGFTAVGEDSFLTISYEKNPAATDLTFQIQSSTDLINWKDESTIEVSPNIYRTSTPVTAGIRQYLRLAVGQ